MLKNIVRASLFCAGLAAMAVQAAPQLISVNGIYTGAIGVDVNGKSYNVSFVDGLFGDVFTGSSWQTFSSEADVWTANSILASLVNNDSVLSSHPDATQGCSSEYFCWIFTPIATRTEDGSYMFGTTGATDEYLRSALVSNGADAGFDFEGVVDSYIFNNFADAPGFTWAKWSEASVPEPVPASLLLGGLMGLVLRRKFSRA